MHNYSHKAVLFLLALFCLCQHAFCQTSFKLDKKRGHYYMTTTVNSRENVKVLLGSRLPGIVVGREVFDKIFDESQYDNVGVSNREYYSDTRKFNIEKALHDKVTFGDVSYTGKIYVIEGDACVAVPVHLLKNEADSTTNLIRLNFKKGTLDFINRDTYDTSKAQSFKVVKYASTPVFETTMELADTYGHESEIKGKFILDLGSGTPVFLFGKNIAEFLKSNNFRLLSATDKSLNTVGKGILAGYCKIGERTHNGISIGITNKLYYDEILGCVGPAFFDNGEIVFDPENETIFYR